MTETIYAIQQQRYDTAANWTANNPVLEEGEIGVESNTRKFKFGDGVTPWNSLPYASSGGGGEVGSLSHTTATLAAGASADFALSTAAFFQLLSFTASTPAWIRVYGTSAARAADTRVAPGGTPPLPGTEFYAELVTTSPSQTIRLSPVPMVQATSGQVFFRVQNRDSVARALTLGFGVLSFAA